MAEIDYDKLCTTTSTIMVYTNTTFNLKAMIENLPCDSSITPQYTKKQKNIDKKKIEATRGSIISVSYGDELHGINTRKKKKIWCTICQPIEITKSGEEKKVACASEVLVPVEGKTDQWKIFYHCEKCKDTYSPTKIKKISNFLNQCNIILSLGKLPVLNIMIFKSIIKIAGCKSTDDAIEGIRLLSEMYLIPSMQNPDPSKRMIEIPNGRLNFTFSTVMENVGFNIGFPINRIALNELMNKQVPDYTSRVYMSEFDSTESTSVKIKMYAIRPTTLPDKCLIYDTSKEKFEMSETEHISYNIDDGYDTFLVFSSGQCNLTGRFNTSKKDNFEFFVQEIKRNRHLLEERLVPNNLAKVTGFHPIETLVKPVNVE